MNKNIDIALTYHENTKHSPISIMTSRHYLDWTNRPIPFKIYTELTSISLPTDFSIPKLNAISAIGNFAIITSANNNINNIDNTIQKGNSNNNGFTLKDLATILFFSAGITREKKYDNGTYYMRAASATGALYPIELYIVCKKINNDIKSGVYHFNPADFSLTLLRNGDYRKELSEYVANNTDILESPLTIILTSIGWRNAWKYQARSYRHWFWDGGVIAANLFAITSSLNIYSKVLNGFIDDKVNDLLLLEKEKEETIAIIPIGIGLSNDDFDNSSQNIKYNKIPLPKIRPLSNEEIQYPEILKIHNNSKLFTIEEVKEWSKSWLNQTFYKNATKNDNPSNEQKINRYILKINQKIPHIPSIGEVILKRGSTRKFAKVPIQFSILSDILFFSTRGIFTDIKGYSDRLIDIYLIANNIENINSGGYFLDIESNTLIQIRKKASGEKAENLCLDQPLFKDASAVIFLMANLNKILKIFGNRGYRVSQFESAIIAGKIYLLAYALGIGASGSTFYDDLVTQFFSPHAKDKNTMIAIGIGVPAYSSRSGKMLPIKISRKVLLSGDIGDFK